MSRGLWDYGCAGVRGAGGSQPAHASEGERRAALPRTAGCHARVGPLGGLHALARPLCVLCERYIRHRVGWIAAWLWRSMMGGGGRQLAAAGPCGLRLISQLFKLHVHSLHLVPQQIYSWTNAEAVPTPAASLPHAIRHPCRPCPASCSSCSSGWPCTAPWRSCR